MIQVFVKLTIKNFQYFERFEREAVRLMRKHEGELLVAFETVHHDDNTGEEIHILQFPSEKNFSEFREDCEFVNLADLRAKGISLTEVKRSLKMKRYI